jgi:dihydroflavonol-4-reductase
LTFVIDRLAPEAEGAPVQKSALVIGGSGFVGIHVVDALLEQGFDVAVTRRKSTPTILLRKRPVTLVPGSLDDRASLESAMRGRDVLVVCAGHYPRYSTDLEGSVREGVEQIENALAAAAATGVKRVIYTSSVAVLAHAEGREASEVDVGADDSNTAPSVYVSVKRAMERSVDVWRDRGLDIVSIVLGGCMGPWDLRVGTTGVLVATLAQRLPFWVEGWINLVDVADAAQAHVRAIDTPAARYCIGGHNVRMSELLSLVSERYGVPLVAPRVDVETARSLADEAEHAAQAKKLRVAMPRELVDVVSKGQPVSSDSAERALGLTWSPLDATLDRTHEWLLRHHYVAPLERTRQHAH